MSTKRSPRTESLKIRALNLRNRLWMSPMCQYSSENGAVNDWHLVHYGSRAVGGTGLIMVESTAVGPSHRTTSADLGLWNDAHVDTHRRLTNFLKEAGSAPAVQLLAAGRKSSHMPPWKMNGQNSAMPLEDGGWVPIAPSALAYGALAKPREMNIDDMDEVAKEFSQAARRANDSGYEVVEIHAGHGYLLHQFLSPIANERHDQFGGSLENRMRFPLRVVTAVRDVFPESKPVFVRITATDWIDGGITIEEAQVFAQRLAGLGIDLLDVTSGALEAGAGGPESQGVNVGFARNLKVSSGLLVAPVGEISDSQYVARLLDGPEVDGVMIGRALLRDPYLALHLKETDSKRMWPRQYQRAV